MYEMKISKISHRDVKMQFSVIERSLISALKCYHLQKLQSQGWSGTSLVWLVHSHRRDYPNPSISSSGQVHAWLRQKAIRIMKRNSKHISCHETISFAKRYSLKAVESHFRRWFALSFYACVGHKHSALKRKPLPH